MKRQAKYKNKKLFPHQELDRFKKKNNKLDYKQSDNYFKLQRKDRDNENTIKLRDRQKGNRVRNRSINNHNSQDEKRKFIYNTNIKIEIQNAMKLYLSEVDGDILNGQVIEIDASGICNNKGRRHARDGFSFFKEVDCVKLPG